MSFQAKRCILITGVGHSGTRLVTEMFAKHPDVSVPLSILNSVQKFTPLHRFFIRSMDLTPLSSSEYVIDEDELQFLLESYMLHIDKHSMCFAIKMPYYVLNCLDFFVDYFSGNCFLIWVTRPKDKIVRSYLRRGEDKLFFSNPDEFIRQIKKLDVESRKKYLTSKDPTGFFEELVDQCERKRWEWDQTHPSLRFLQIDIEELATDRGYACEVLQQLNLSHGPVDDMMSVVDEDRLLKDGQRGLARLERRQKSLMRSILPPFVWELVSRVRAGNRG